MKAVLLIALLTMAAPVWAAQVWTAPAALKIRESATAPDSPEQMIALEAAKREYAAFQIALRSDTDIASVTALPTELSGAGTISARRVSIWRQHYVDTIDGRLPDPLSPLRSVDLKAGVTQPLYVEIEIPASAREGDYAGAVSLRADGKEFARVNVRLRVYGFALPATPALTTAFGLLDEPMAEQEGLTKGTAAYERYRRAYYGILLEHGLSAYNIPADLNTDEGARYLNDPRMTSFVIPYSEDDAVQKKTLQRLKSGGWLDKGFFYVVDEPVNKEQYANLIKICERLHALEPRARIIAPYYRGPDFDEKTTVFDLLTGKLDIWCYNTFYHQPDELAKRQAAGDEVWDYVCCGPGKPYANFFIQNDGIDHRILFWQNWKYDTTGLLYWCANYWNGKDTGTKDPWVDMATIKFINKDVYGDGSLLYPGRKAGYPGPLPSLRLKIIRQGMQDYDYIAMAAAAAGPARVRRIVDTQAASWSDYQKDPIALNATRARLAALILADKIGS
ncbi:MAG: DUF4091 domain-containing protein [Armatimonadetes bacterium]|nr:DUF4091 domain-containing protein [Armatimonadota bacterium]